MRFDIGECSMNGKWDLLCAAYWFSAEKAFNQISWHTRKSNWGQSKFSSSFRWCWCHERKNADHLT